MQDEFGAQLPAPAETLPPLPIEGGRNGTATAPSELPTAARGETARTQRALDRPAKAAIIVRLLLNEGADIPLEELPEDLQARLTQQMGRMGLVDRDTLTMVALEFAETLDGVGLSFPNGMAGALDALEGRISAHTAARLRKEAGVRQRGDPWPRLCALPEEDLTSIMQAESTEVAAVLMSKLDTAKAASILGQLPGPQARRITYAMSLTRGVTPDAVQRIGLSLAAQVDARPDIAFSDGPGERLGAILNRANGATRDDVLTSLDETDRDFAAAVRKAIFTFENIPERIEPREVPQLVRGLDQAQLVSALAGAGAMGFQDQADFLLDNLSNRMADNLRDEIADQNSIKPAEAEAAMGAIVDQIREMEAAGTITLITPEEED